ncbi:protein N-terminal asparagine amidohydrolase isoform X2 [Panicum hallii]|uniref:protein N-terminal asparagine amidohydrolase isoform X2 n=1 Tax=Panicum hallii TaxID=206008 RepID=UPI000DF4E237|nr:protein N-terminal asparagine amidohydrolase isoform X2 [Panicum hallii]
MLLVDGEPVLSTSAAAASRTGAVGVELVAALAGHPGLRDAADRLKATSETRISAGREGAPRHVYVFQREYATVDPARVEVHLIGGFSDASTKVVRSSGKKHIKQEGYSYPLCCKIVEVLHKSQQQFHLRSFCVLENNTTTDSLGNTLPVIGGFVVQTTSGVVTPASFDMNSRCPDEVVRRIRVSVCSYDPTWQGRLLETYDTQCDVFRIAPACWMPNWADIASSLNQLSDSEVLMQCSTSPAAEPPHFVENERRIWKYLINNPDWEETFPKHKPRVFHRTSDGSWSRYS